MNNLQIPNRFHCDTFTEQCVREIIRKHASLFEGLVRHRYLNYVLDADTPHDIEVPCQSELRFTRHPNGWTFRIKSKRTDDYLPPQYVYSNRADMLEDFSELLFRALNVYDIPDIDKLINLVTTCAITTFSPVSEVRTN